MAKVVAMATGKGGLYGYGRMFQHIKKVRAMAKKKLNRWIPIVLLRTKTSEKTQSNRAWRDDRTRLSTGGRTHVGPL